MSKCNICGAKDHQDQREKYPVEAKVFLFNGTNGIVIAHCDDGRAVIAIDGNTHTFHFIDSYVDSVVLPSKQWAPVDNGSFYTLGRELVVDDYMITIHDEATGEALNFRLPDNMRMCKVVNHEKP